MKSNSRIFKSILELVISGQVAENFRVANVLSALGTSFSFLSKHSIDANDPSKKSEGNAYFIRTNVGLYKINPIYSNMK